MKGMRDGVMGRKAETCRNVCEATAGQANLKRGMRDEEYRAEGNGPRDHENHEECVQDLCAAVHDALEFRSEEARKAGS